MSKTTDKFSPEMRERAVQVVFDRSHCGAISPSPMAEGGSVWGALAGNHVDFGKDWLRAADPERLGQEGQGR